MEQRKVNVKLKEKKQIRFLFFLCWIAYFSTYIGRLNYSAGLTEIIRTEGFSKGQAGMIGTGFFFAYGIGQFVSGFLGDRLSPKKMVFTGLGVSGICNLLMAAGGQPVQLAACWCVNGLFQAFIWSPMIRLMFDYYETETRMRSCVSLNSSVPIGTMAAYGLTAAVIWLLGWRQMFVFAGILLLFVSVIWLLGMNRIENIAAGSAGAAALAEPGGQKEIPGRSLSFQGLLIESGFLFLMMALFVQGALKDGVTTWVPTYISETYGLNAVLAITSTMIIPVFNLLGVYLASAVNLKWFHDEIRTAGAFFLLSAGALLILRICSGQSLFLSFAMLAAATTAMMAVNTMLIAVLPSYFGVLGKASSVSGLLNSAVYAGGAVSTYGIGALSVGIGWNATIFIWVWMAAMSCVICCFVQARWKKWRKKFL